MALSSRQTIAGAAPPTTSGHGPARMPGGSKGKDSGFFVVPANGCTVFGYMDRGTWKTDLDRSGVLPEKRPAREPRRPDRS